MPKQLSLGILASRHKGLTAKVAAAMEEAGAVCLESQGHSAPATLQCQGITPCQRDIVWASSDPKAHNAWDWDEATAQGATCVSIALLEDLAGLRVLQRSWKGTGFDYWVGQPGATLFQGTMHLEVSGVRANPGAVHGRVKQKRAQVHGKSPGLPGYVCVVEFSQPLAVLEKT